MIINNLFNSAIVFSRESLLQDQRCDSDLKWKIGLFSPQIQDTSDCRSPILLLLMFSIGWGLHPLFLKCPGLRLNFSSSLNPSPPAQSVVPLAAAHLP